MSRHSRRLSVRPWRLSSMLERGAVALITSAAIACGAGAGSALQDRASAAARAHHQKLTQCRSTDSETRQLEQSGRPFRSSTAEPVGDTRFLASLSGCGAHKEYEVHCYSDGECIARDPDDFHEPIELQSGTGGLLLH